MNRAASTDLQEEPSFWICDLINQVINKSCNWNTLKTATHISYCQQSFIKQKQHTKKKKWHTKSCKTYANLCNRKHRIISPN